MLTRNHAMSLLGRGSLPQSNMIINTKAFSYTASKAFSSTMLAKRSAPFLPTYHAMTTAPDSRVEWFFVPDSVLDRLDTGAAKLAFQKSNPFNDPEVHNCKISFLPDDKYATWTETRRKSTVHMPLPRSEEASTVRHQLNKVVGPHIGKVSYECIAKSDPRL